MNRFGLFIFCGVLFVARSNAQHVAASASSYPVAAPKPAQPEGKFSRWLDVKTLSFGMRYRNAADADGLHLFDYGQQRSLIEGRIKLDAAGKYAVHFRVSSGRDFRRAYADVIGGTFADFSPLAVANFPADRVAEFADSTAVDPKAKSVLHEFGVTRAGKCPRGSSTSVPLRSNNSRSNMVRSVSSAGAAARSRRTDFDTLNGRIDKIMCGTSRPGGTITGRGEADVPAASGAVA